MLDDSDSPFLQNGSYKVNLMSESQKDICSDQPAGIQLNNGQKEDVVVPPGVIIIRDFLGKQACKKITDFSDQQTGSRLQVMYRDPATGEVSTKPDEGRITEHVDITDIADHLMAILKKVCQKIVAPYYKVDIEWYEKPSMLRYGSEGKYDYHADSENWDASKQVWSKFCDRAYSILIYLNDDFTGGLLRFNNFDFSLAPVAGTLVVFPSDHRYVHCAEPVLSGTRYVIVSWLVVKERRHFTRGKPFPPHAVPLS